MKIINIYDSKDEAEAAKSKIKCDSKIVSDREDNHVIYKLFAIPSWNVFYQLEMFNLPELQRIVEAKKVGNSYDEARHKEILSMLDYSAKSFDLEIPKHWR
jgi:hypothetical protein